MRDPGEVIQRALYAVLTADADLTAITPRVFDRVPVDNAGKVTALFPFVQLGSDDSVEDGDACADGAETEVDVHAWSRAVGKVEAKRMTDRIAQVCDADLLLPGFDLISHQVVAIRDIPNDGLTTHRVVTLRYLTNPTT